MLIPGAAIGGLAMEPISTSAALILAGGTAAGGAAGGLLAGGGGAPAPPAPKKWQIKLGILGAIPSLITSIAGIVEADRMRKEWRAATDPEQFRYSKGAWASLGAEEGVRDFLKSYREQPGPQPYGGMLAGAKNGDQDVR